MVTVAPRNQAGLRFHVCLKWSGCLYYRVEPAQLSDLTGQPGRSVRIEHFYDVFDVEMKQVLFCLKQMAGQHIKEEYGVWWG